MAASDRHQHDRRSTACCSGPGPSCRRSARSTDRLATPNSPEAQDLLARYIAAFEAYDIERLVELFTSEAIWEMPPYTGWYQGPRDIITLIHQQCPAEFPATCACSRWSPTASPPRRCTCGRAQVHVPFQLHVLDMRADGVSRVVAFLDDSLFAKFGLPERL